MHNKSHHTAGLHAGRLSAEQYQQQFNDHPQPLTATQAIIEANRCYYCYDAPCTKACPADIDVPSFIQRIAQANTLGAAQAILSANELGGMCARVCPTEELCEHDCVRNSEQHKPVEIGRLQRYATDWFFDQPQQAMFERAAESGFRVAVVGSGPAGLSVAHRLARLGHQVVLFEAKEKLGGLNEYGLASYKTTHDFAQREINWLLSVGGIEVRTSQQLGRDIHLADLQQQYDALFLGLGLAAVNPLGISEPDAPGIMQAVDFIAELRQAPSYAEVAVGREVVVIGGGMTAVDAAVQAKKLGAAQVTMVYRRDESALKASEYEINWARQNGVTVRCQARPVAFETDADGDLQGVLFHETFQRDGQWGDNGESFFISADMVLKAIGQCLQPLEGLAALNLEQGRIAVDEQGQTSLSGVWAGGDCVAGGLDLTVDAVRLAKLAAASMDSYLRQLSRPAGQDKEYAHG